MWIETIRAKCIRREPELGNDTDLLDDLIDESLEEIVSYANANRYDIAWDRTLVKCVLTKYRTIGIEGSKTRNAGGASDTYESSEPTSVTIARNIKQQLKPVGYAYSSTRFNRPV